MKTKNDPHLLKRRTLDVINEASQKLLLLYDDLPPSLTEELQTLNLVEHILSDEYLFLIKELFNINSPLLTEQERNDYGPAFKQPN